MTQTGKEPESGPPSSGAVRSDGPSGAEFAGLGFQFVVLIVAGMFAGQWLDRKFASAPWFLMGGVFLGAVLAFASIYQRLIAADAHGKATSRKQAP